MVQWLRIHLPMQGVWVYSIPGRGAKPLRAAGAATKETLWSPCDQRSPALPRERELARCGRDPVQPKQKQRKKTICLRMVSKVDLVGRLKQKSIEE